MVSHGDLPQPNDGVDSCKRLYDKLRESLNEARQIFKSVAQAARLDELLKQLQKIASEDATAYCVSRVCEIERGLKERGIQRLIEEIRISQLPAQDWILRFEYIWLSSTLDLAALNDPAVRAFVGSTHNRYVEDFKSLDASRIELAAFRVRRAHGEHAIAAMNEFPDQETSSGARRPRVAGTSHSVRPLQKPRMCLPRSVPAGWPAHSRCVNSWGRMPPLTM